MTSEELKKLVGQNIRKHRELKRWTQEELAGYTGINRSYLASIEIGFRNISLSTLATIASALEVHPHQLLVNQTLIEEAIER